MTFTTGIVVGVLSPIAVLWAFYTLKESLPKAFITYITAWKTALKIALEKRSN